VTPSAWYDGEEAQDGPGDPVTKLSPRMMPAESPALASPTSHSGRRRGLLCMIDEVQSPSGTLPIADLAGAGEDESVLDDLLDDIFGTPMIIPAPRSESPSEFRSCEDQDPDPFDRDLFEALAQEDKPCLVNARSNSSGETRDWLMIFRRDRLRASPVG
jgi:hypothetical protein